MTRLSAANAVSVVDLPNEAVKDGVIMHSIGLRLAQLRRERHLTQKELAAVVGVDQSTLSNWEVGVLPIADKWLARLSAAVKVSESYLRGSRASFTPAPLGLHGAMRRRLCGQFELPLYDVRGHLDQMLALGSVAYECYTRARDLHAPDVLDRVIESFPRDAVHELLAYFQMLAHGMQLRRTTLSHLGCPLPAIDGPMTWRNALDCGRDVLVLEGTHVLFVGVPQVWIPLPRSNRSCRPDLLVLYVRGSRKMWVDVEFDGSHHTDYAQVDIERAGLLGLPRMGYANLRIRQAALVDLILDDLETALQRKRRVA